jgi:hypothetical protein
MICTPNGVSSGLIDRGFHRHTVDLHYFACFIFPREHRGSWRDEEIVARECTPSTGMRVAFSFEPGGAING